jgi:hypothetical protein
MGLKITYLHYFSNTSPTKKVRVGVLKEQDPDPTNRSGDSPDPDPDLH